jgi:hypothetical protein
VERLVATLHPDQTWEKVVFSPWRQKSWDVNDTLLLDPGADPDVGHFFRALTASEYLPTWYQQRSDGRNGSAEQAAAFKTAAHANTPTTAHFDALGRTVLTVADNGKDAAGAALKYSTRVTLDIAGHPIELTDAMNRVAMRYEYDLLGHRIHEASMDAGERWMLNDVAGQPHCAWDSRGHTFRTEYDRLRRPLRAYVTGADPEHPLRELLTERFVYGEQCPDAERLNLRGRPGLHLDPAGLLTHEAHDFKGNLLAVSRRVATQYTAAIDWTALDAALPAQAADPLDVDRFQAAMATSVQAQTHTTRTTHDALNRAVEMTAPDHSVIRHGYGEDGRLTHVEAQVRGATAATVFVNRIEHDAKGLRTRIALGNGAVTEYSYDKLSLRLTRLKTGCKAAERSAVLQDLSYTYDPAGNITRICDDAQQTIYFNGQVVAPQCDYVYDPVYRLIKASGREHIGQLAQPQTSWNDVSRIGQPQPGDGQAMRNYTEEYHHDAAGNLEKLVHLAEMGNWTRTHLHNEPSLMGSGNCTSNRLSGTVVADSHDAYTCDAHGNMTRLPHLSSMQWDCHDQLQQSARQSVN